MSAHRIFFFLCLVSLAGLARAGESPPAAHPLFKDFMGINGHTIQFKPQLYRPIGIQVRDYHPVEWDLGKDSDSVPPFPFARNGVDWGAVYGSWRKEGWRIDASLMFETLSRDRWKGLAADCLGYAERFARAFGPSGTNALVETVEVGNEPGKFSDADYRVVFENMSQGFRRGDPKLRIATCAMTVGKSHDYAKSVECLEGLESHFDILNVHTYAQLEGWPTWKRSFPEDPELKEYLPDVRRLCDWRDRRATAKEIWITEFGYDASTRSPDPKTEFKNWVGVSEIQQAQWIVRSWLIFSALPVQRAYLYFFNDEDSPHVHGSSGLTRHFQPKPAFYAVAHLQKTLGEYRFNRAVIERPGQAMLYEYAHGTDPQLRIWVAWSPTGSNRTSTLELPTGHGTILCGETMPLLPSPSATLNISTQPSQIQISESPVYLFLRSPKG